jgi:glycosyltransferase involved in cell wall biosynthesis
MPWAGPTVAGTAAAAGGAETQIVMVARGLAARGLRVGLMVMDEPSGLPRQAGGVDVIPLRQPTRIRGLGGGLRDLLQLRALLRAPARAVVQRNAGRTTLVAALAARLRRSRFVYSSASVVDFELERVETFYNARLFNLGLRVAHGVVVQTEEQRRLCRERFGREATVVRSVAEPAERRDEAPEAFLWAGRLAPYKGLDAYIDLAAAVPEARFQVVGVPVGRDIEPVERLERAGRELPNLEVLQPMPRAALGRLIERAVAVVNTSQFEGMPNVFLEGWARGVPALALAHDPDGVIVEHGLGDFAAGSRERLAGLARAQWASRADQGAVGDRCVEYVRRHHSLDAACAAWLAALVPEGSP